VQANFAGVEGVLDEAWMVFAHNILHRFAPASAFSPLQLGGEHFEKCFLKT
jgi:hypothetical protein